MTTRIQNIAKELGNPFLDFLVKPITVRVVNANQNIFGVAEKILPRTLAANLGPFLLTLGTLKLFSLVPKVWKAQEETSTLASKALYLAAKASAIALSIFAACISNGTVCYLHDTTNILVVNGMAAAAFYLISRLRHIQDKGSQEVENIILQVKELRKYAEESGLTDPVVHSFNSIPNFYINSLNSSLIAGYTASSRYQQLADAFPGSETTLCCFGTFHTVENIVPLIQKELSPNCKLGSLSTHSISYTRIDESIEIIFKGYYPVLRSTNLQFAEDGFIVVKRSIKIPFTSLNAYYQSETLTGCVVKGSFSQQYLKPLSEAPKETENYNY